MLSYVLLNVYINNLVVYLMSWFSWMTKIHENVLSKILGPTKFLIFTQLANGIDNEI